MQVHLYFVHQSYQTTINMVTKFLIFLTFGLIFALGSAAPSSEEDGGQQEAAVSNKAVKPINMAIPTYSEDVKGHGAQAAGMMVEAPEAAGMMRPFGQNKGMAGIAEVSMENGQKGELGEEASGPGGNMNKMAPPTGGSGFRDRSVAGKAVGGGVGTGGTGGNNRKNKARKNVAGGGVGEGGTGGAGLKNKSGANKQKGSNAKAGGRGMNTRNGAGGNKQKGNKANMNAKNGEGRPNNGK